MGTLGESAAVDVRKSSRKDESRSLEGSGGGARVVAGLEVVK